MNSDNPLPVFLRLSCALITVTLLGCGSGAGPKAPGAPGAGVAEHLPGEHVSVYVPTTPNPTSGFFLMLAKSDVVELDMSVDAALRYVVSMGVVAPGAAKNGGKAAASAHYPPL